MKVLFIETRKKVRPIKISKDLPEKLHILYTIQYQNLARAIKLQLAAEHRVVSFNQILGCSRIKLKASPLLIGSGKFHALQLASSTGREVFVYDNGKIEKIGSKEIEKLKKREHGKISRFLSSDIIGILVSIKTGQKRTKEAIKLKHELKDRFKDKDFFLFISNTLDIKQLENFPIQIFISTSCPGLDLDSHKILYYKKLLK
jgi:diphthamide biosynthesis enzyme Dph1/Dph2-like protein